MAADLGTLAIQDDEGRSNDNLGTTIEAGILSSPSDVVVDQHWLNRMPCA